MRLITGGFVLVVLWMSLVVNSGEDRNNQEFFHCISKKNPQESQLIRDKEVLN